jgi:hypothetical protein
MTSRVKPPSGGDEAPTVSSRLGARGPRLDLVPLAREICHRYRGEFPDEETRYGDAGNAWCVHDNRHLLNWAVEDVNGDLDLHHEVAWLASVLEARGFPTARLARNLDLGAQVVSEQVTGAGGRKLAATLTDAAEFVRLTNSFIDFEV